MRGLTKLFIWIYVVLLVALLFASAQNNNSISNNSINNNSISNSSINNNSTSNSSISNDSISSGPLLNSSLSPIPDDFNANDSMAEKYFPEKFYGIRYTNNSEKFDASINNSSSPSDLMKESDLPNSTWDGKTLSIKPLSPDSTDENIIANISQNRSDGRSDEAKSPPPINQSNRSKIIVHNGERIQAAIDSAAS